MCSWSSVVNDPTNLNGNHSARGVEPDGDDHIDRHVRVGVRVWGEKEIVHFRKESPTDTLQTGNQVSILDILVSWGKINLRYLDGVFMYFRSVSLSQVWSFTISVVSRICRRLGPGNWNLVLRSLAGVEGDW